MDALRAAVCFRLIPDGTFHGDFVGDFVGDGAAPWPRTLEEISPDVLALWQAYAAHVRSATLRAHLHDLLTAAAVPPVHSHARAAISAYREAVPAFLAAGEKTSGRLRAVESLTRALGLAAKMNKCELRGLVVRDILSLAADLLDADPVPFGLVYRLLDALHARRLELDAVRDLIECACVACADNIHLQVAFLRMLRAMNPDPAAQKGIDRRIVTAMIAHADGTPTGMLRLLESTTPPPRRATRV